MNGINYEREEVIVEHQNDKSNYTPLQIAFNTMKLHYFDRDSNIKFASNNELNHEYYDKYDVFQYLK